MKQFRAGVIGIGFIGAAHIEALRRLGNVTVEALCSRTNPDKKAASLCVPSAYPDYREMLDREKLDCVHICTPNNSHFEIAKYALERGVHVVLEKPMTCSISEAQELLAVAKKTGLVHGINFNCRFYPMVYEMREMVRTGALGNIYHIGGSYLQDWLYLDTDYSWRLEKEWSGKSRVFADIGTHWMDLVQFVTGSRVSEVLADFAIFHKTRKKPLKAIDTFSGMALSPEDYAEKTIDTEDYAHVAFHMENGAHGSCTVSQVFAGRKNKLTVSVGGSKRALTWDSENSNALWIGSRESANGELVKDPSILSAPTGKITSYPGGHVEGFPDTFKQTFKKIYEAIEAGTQPAKPDFADFNDGLAEMILIENIVKSANERRWVSI
ncbi:MAG: Gfo/Idh/MocA family oxidoreductase [Treponema sp.]|nr:Gfo/Idh/MocA family oxidoreductase [Treponema sp.]